MSEANVIALALASITGTGLCIIAWTWVSDCIAERRHRREMEARGHNPIRPR